MLKNEIYRAAYDFHEKWSPFPKNPDEWLLATKEMGELAASYQEELLNGFLIAIFEDLEREYKKCPRKRIDLFSISGKRLEVCKKIWKRVKVCKKRSKYTAVLRLSGNCSKVAGYHRHIKTHSEYFAGDSSTRTEGPHIQNKGGWSRTAGQVEVYTSFRSIRLSFMIV